MSGLKLGIVAIFVTFVACGPREQVQEKEEAPARATALQGSWQLGCQEDTGIHKLSKYVDNYFIFSGNSYIKIQRGFSEPSSESEAPCQPSQHTYTLSESGIFVLTKSGNESLKEDSATPNQWGEIKFVNRYYTLTPENRETSIEWRAGRLCEISDWETAHDQSVGGKKCEGVRLYDTSSETLSVRHEESEGEVYIRFGDRPLENLDPSFDENLRYRRLPNLPFALKKPHKKNTHLVKGYKRNQQK